MSKPRWAPELTAEQRKDGFRFCDCCGWRLTREGTCETCRARAAEMPPQSAPARRIRVPAVDTPAYKRRGWTAEQAAFMEAFVPTTCAACGAGGHVSTDCPTKATDQARPHEQA